MLVEAETVRLTLLITAGSTLYIPDMYVINFLSWNSVEKSVLHYFYMMCIVRYVLCGEVYSKAS